MRRILATILALALAGSALAEGEPSGNPGELQPTSNSGEFGVTLTCSARLPTGVVGCFIERPVLVLGALEVALGVDAQANFSNAASGHLAPYVLLAVYQETWSAWAEVRLPELYNVPVLGDPDYLRVGFSLRL